MENKAIKHGVRQGDVLLVNRGPKKLRHDHKRLDRDEFNRIVLMEGEVTGHAHAVLDANVEYVETSTADAVERWLRVGAGGATLVHEEHAAHRLKPNTDYEQWFQYEYQPQELRRVAD